MTSAARVLIVTADDFGISRGVNRGIVEAHREGILTSTSLMVSRPAAVEAAALGRACPALSVGLHLELDPGAPDLPTQLDRQLGRFTELVGAPPTHVDSHHDVHRDPRVLPHVRAWADRFSVPVRRKLFPKPLHAIHAQSHALGMVVAKIKHRVCEGRGVVRFH